MAKYHIYKSLMLVVEVEAETAQEAYDEQLNMDDSDFVVRSCDYEVVRAWENGNLTFVTDEVEMQ